MSKYSLAIEDLVKKIEIVKMTVSYCKDKQLDDTYRIWNIAGFILMLSLDIKLINEQLLIAKGFGRSEFAIKSACILIYEALEDLEQILGKDFYQSMDNLSISSIYVQDLNDKKKALSNLKSIHQNDLRKVRAVIGAHRDHDFLTQLEIFNSLENRSIFELLNDFERKLNALSEPLQKVMEMAVHSTATGAKK